MHQLCKLFILPLQIPQQPEETLPCREAGAVSCTGRRAKGRGGGGGFSLHFGYSIDFIGVTSDSSRLRWKASPKLKQVNDML